MINFKTGDVLSSPDKYIAHGVNASNGFGSGVAGAIARKYPKAKEDYHKWYESGHLRLGSYFPSHQPDGKIILHCCTQQNFGGDGRKYVDYQAIADCMSKLNEDLVDIRGIYIDSEGTLVNEPEVIKLSMPLIGAGLGGGSWETILKIIESNLTSEYIDTTIYSLEHFTR